MGLKILVLLLCISVVAALLRATTPVRLLRRQPRLFMASDDATSDELLGVDKLALKKMRESLKVKEYGKAFTILKRNPMMHITIDDARVLLNHVNELTDWESEKGGAGGKEGGPVTMDYDQYEKKMTEGATFIYKRLSRQNLARGFGCLNDEWPVPPTTDTKPSVIQEMTGLEMTALTPQPKSLVWQLAGLALFFAEFEIGDRLGIDPIFTLIPATLLLFLSDQILYKGAGFESIYQLLNPSHREKIIRHEAGHFLLAYLAGIPVRACVTNAREAMKYPEISGAAGTVFYDTKLQNEMSGQKVTRTSINRLSVVLMAGIAAEAMHYKKAEGGATDERSLIQFLTTIQPPWNILRVQGQARWAALQAILILREHEASYEALVAALQAGEGIGDCVQAIENNLPVDLPAAKRVNAKELRKASADMNAIFNFVRKAAFNAGGIEKSTVNKDETRLSLQVATKGSSADEAARLMSVIDSQGGISAVETLARTTTRTDDSNPTSSTSPSSSSSAPPSPPVVSSDALLDQFSKKIGELERRAEAGELTELPEDPSSSSSSSPPPSPSPPKSWGNKKLDGGGVWLNDLRSLSPDTVTPLNTKDGEEDEKEEKGGGGGTAPPPAPTTVVDLSDPNLSFKKIVSMPKPLPDFETRLSQLEEKEKEEKVVSELVEMGWVVEEAPPQAALEMAQQQELDSLPVASSTPVSDAADSELKGVLDGYERSLALLTSHRGYLMKQQENALNKQRARREEIETRLDAIAALVGTSRY
jgi:hypothetical protein